MWNIRRSAKISWESDSVLEMENSFRSSGIEAHKLSVWIYTQINMI
jgi:hypothetical protein